MDPLSIVGTAIALTEVSGKIVKLLKDVQHVAANIKTYLEQLAREIEQVRSTGENIKNLLDATEAVSRDKLPAENLFNLDKQWVSIHVEVRGP
jgi:hypothetical protein